MMRSSLRCTLKMMGPLRWCLDWLEMYPGGWCGARMIQARTILWKKSFFASCVESLKIKKMIIQKIFTRYVFWNMQFDNVLTQLSTTRRFRCYILVVSLTTTNYTIFRHRRNLFSIKNISSQRKSYSATGNCFLVKYLITLILLSVKISIWCALLLMKVEFIFKLS